MNIVYLIGNGFDLNLGLSTRYSDFYNYYSSKDTTSELITTLKNKISTDYKNWSDLEMALGNYTNNLNSIEEFEDIFDDILDNLGDYLKTVEDKFDFSIFSKEKLCSYLSRPEESLLKADADEIMAFRQTWVAQDWNVRIITFNYTSSLEKLLNYDSVNLQLGVHHRNPIVLKSLEHLHGYVDNRMVMGINDISQMSNTNFHFEQDVLEAFVKSHCNKAQKHTIDNVCSSQISKANLICIFGSSIGDTDNCWWELIGEQLKRGCKLIIFTKGEEISRRKEYKKARIERIMRDYFLNKTKLTNEEKINFSSNIYVGVNTEMFSDLKQ